MEGRKRAHSREGRRVEMGGLESSWLRMRETMSYVPPPSLLVITHLHTQTEELHNTNNLLIYTLVKQSVSQLFATENRYEFKKTAFMIEALITANG